MIVVVGVLNWHTHKYRKKTETETETNQFLSESPRSFKQFLVFFFCKLAYSLHITYISSRIFKRQKQSSAQRIEKGNFWANNNKNNVNDDATTMKQFYTHYSILLVTCSLAVLFLLVQPNKINTITENWIECKWFVCTGNMAHMHIQCYTRWNEQTKPETSKQSNEHDETHVMDEKKGHSILH